MKISKIFNTTIITNNNNLVLDMLKDEIIVSSLDDLKHVSSKFIVFNDFFRNLKKSEVKVILDNMEQKDIHFLNITSDMEECLYTNKLIIVEDGKIVIEGSTMSVLKEEKLLKKYGYKIPFVIDLSLRLNESNIIDSIFLDEELLVNKLW